MKELKGSEKQIAWAEDIIYLYLSGERMDRSQRARAGKTDPQR